MSSALLFTVTCPDGITMMTLAVVTEGSSCISHSLCSRTAISALTSLFFFLSPFGTLFLNASILAVH